uniref:Odorant binding protein 2 n=1 Tax=Trissolcus japonicus TaxID=1388796 RepID=A0A7G6J4J8_9HYME|nr:odorant binding protein 2 [Trissolcus japonicus]
MSRTFFNAVVCVAVLQATLVIAKRPDFIDDDMMEMIKEDKTQCMQEHGTTEDMIEKASERNVANDPHITCYISCMLTRLGMMTDDGVIDADMMLSVIPDDIQDVAAKVLDTCGTLTGADKCEKMYNAVQCIINNCPEMWFIV